ncbi:MAG: sulfatase [Parabacteroides gordonii]|nr:sulfatase [Parabacteroides gordonii]
MFCIADDVSFPHMSAYGVPWVHTPGFDRIAQDGLLFQQAYTCNAKSAPSRSAIITGRNSWQLEEACNHWPKFPAKFKSYPEALAEHGYYVGCTGKGWGPGVAKDSTGVNRQLTGKNWSEIKLEAPTKGISSVDYAANFKAFFQNRPKDKPFCFWYGALEPHRGYEYASSIRAGKSVDQIDSVPSFWPDNEVVRTDMLDYALEIEHFDKHLQSIIQTLEEAGELDNTIIVVTADHGMPFPRCKGQEYEYSNHIPFAVMWKNGIKNPGRAVNEKISVIDLAPTFLELAGVDQKESGMQPITGRSFTDILEDSPIVEDRDYVLIGKERHDVGRPHDQGYPIRGLLRGDYLYLINFETGRWPAGNPETGYLNVDGSPIKTEVIQSRRKPNDIYWNLSFGKRGEEELYNIWTDRECMTNLIGQNEFAELKSRMCKELLEQLRLQEDPRIVADGSIFDTFEYQGAERMVWDRMKVGEKVKLGFVNSTDFEPEATGLEVDWTDD